MSRVTSPAHLGLSVDPVPAVPGLDGMAIRNLSELQVFLFLHEMNPHITRRRVRDGVLRGELRGVKHGNKNLFSRNDALAWMNGDTTDAVQA